MTVDPKSISADPFPRAVNRDLRYLVALREEETAERAELFDERDGLLAELEDLDEGSEEATEVEVKHSRVVRKIERKAKIIAWCNQQIGKLVKKADDRTLYSDSVEVPPPEPPASLFTHKKGGGDAANNDAGDDDEPDERPVGEPAAPPAHDDDEEAQHAPGAANTTRMREEEEAEALQRVRANLRLLVYPGRFIVRSVVGTWSSPDIIAGDEDRLVSDLCDIFGSKYRSMTSGGLITLYDKRGTKQSHWVERVGDAPGINTTTGEISAAAEPRKQTGRKKTSKKSRAKAAK